MLTVVGCFVGAHDLWLVALAATVCALSAFTTVVLLHHAHRSARRLRAVWLAVAAVAGGSGIWATHFLAMLAFEPGLPSGYDLGLTLISLLIAILLTGLGLGVSLLTRVPFAPAMGGAILGLGIAAMHYTGMAAFEVAGRISWHPALVAASLGLGALLGALALPVALSRRGLKGHVGSLLLIGAICGHHFTAMGGVTILPDPTLAISETALPARWLPAAVALASFAILLLACAALALDIRDRRNGQLEAERLRSLANAAVEGLV